MSDKGLLYRPELRYDPGDMPPNRFVERLVEDEEYVSAESLGLKLENIQDKVDFMLHKTEQQLAGTEYGGVSFEDYKDLAVRSYYCTEPLSADEEDKLSSFEEGAQGLEGSVAGDIYLRLLQFKQDFEEDERQAQTIRNLSEHNIDCYLSGVVSGYEDLDAEAILKRLAHRYRNLDDEIYMREDKREYRAKLFALSQEVKFRERRRDELAERYEEAVDTGDREKARGLKREIDELDKEIQDLTNNVNYAARQSYALHRKAEKADDYLERIYYLLNATAYDNLDGKVCCMLKLFLQTLNLDWRTEKLDEMEREIAGYSLQELREAVDALRGILAIGFGKHHREAERVFGKLRNLIMSPVRSLLNSVITRLRELESGAISNAEDLFEKVAHLNPEDPQSLLDCLYLESFGDVIYDLIDDIFSDMEDKIVDLYKIVYSYTDFVDQDLVAEARKERLRQLYDLLTEFATALNTLDRFSLARGVEEWTESFLIKKGFGETYDPGSGRFEPIDLHGCIDPAPYTGRSRSHLPAEPADVTRVDLEADSEFQEFQENNDRTSYECTLQDKVAQLATEGDDVLSELESGG